MAGGRFLVDGVGWGGWVAGVLLLGWVLRTLRWVWWTPRSTERKLRAQGIDGTSYRFLFGDIRETMRLTREAKSKPMPFSHDIPPRVLPFHHQIVKTYGKVSMTWLGVSPRVIIADPLLIREVLLNKSGHIGKPKLGPLGQLLTGGLLSYDGEKWAMHRKIINPAFHVEKLKRMLPAFSYCCAELVRRWESLLNPEGSCEVDVWLELQNFTRDVISRTAFGSSFEKGKRIFQLQDEQAELVLQSLQNFQIPGHREVDREMEDLLREIIARREKALRQAAPGAANGDDDLLGLLLQSNQVGFQEDGTSRGVARMTTEEVIEECKLFYFAGQETTSILLTWAMVALAMHPSWQDRARAEVLQVFGREKPDFARLSQLKIVTMVLHEVLRLYPPVLFLSRITRAATTVGEYSLPAGVQLQLAVLLVQHDPEYWGDDAGDFNPERLAEGVSRASKNQSPAAGTAFFPFGGGVRVCVGQGFAMVEAKMGLVSILQSFSFELSPAYTHAPSVVMTLQPQYGAQVILRRL
ncbi:unnamed protein product [Spirodela intermedia]|uniref:Cytochrome P450 n=1 Tax=Spirodela intermedia TaxID=51605 RepID=A0ABN7EB31_SPIIN|nr:unnamed protein product [Spirodela intermedia]